MCKTCFISRIFCLGVFAWLNHCRFFSAYWKERTNTVLVIGFCSCISVIKNFYFILHYLQGDGPLAEVDFWRERNDTLSALTEQIKLPEVQKVLEILQEAESEHVGALQVVLGDLRKHHVEAGDSIMFLSTLERHLKVRLPKRTL